RAGERIRDIILLLSPAVEYVGAVLEPNGKPAPGALVKLLSAGEGETALSPLPDNFTSDAKGEFRFVAPAGALLEATHPDFSPGRAYVSQTVQASRRLEIRLAPRSDVQQREAIAGRVLDPKATPLAGASVSAVRQGRWRREDYFRPDVKTDP